MHIIIFVPTCKYENPDIIVFNGYPNIYINDNINGTIFLFSACILANLGAL